MYRSAKKHRGPNPPQKKNNFCTWAHSFNSELKSNYAIFESKTKSKPKSETSLMSYDSKKEQLDFGVSGIPPTIIRANPEPESLLSSDQKEFDFDLDLNGIAPIAIGLKPESESELDATSQGRKPNVMLLFRRMLLSRKMDDLTIVIGNEQYLCFKEALKCYSKYFREYPTSDVVEFSVKNLSMRGFVMMYNWILADRPILLRNSLIELCRAATYLGVGELIKHCLRCIVNNELIREKAAMNLFDEAQAQHFYNLNPVLLTRISKYFLAFVGSNSFLNMSVNDVCVLLSSDDISVNSEMEVLAAAVRWLVYDFENREVYRMTVLGCVRFSLLPCWYISLLGDKMECISFNKVLNNRQVREMADFSLSYSTNLECIFRDEIKFDEFISTYKYDIPKKRVWIFDKRCPYHHHIQCRASTQLTLERFKTECTSFQSDESWINLEPMAYEDDVKKGMRYCMNRQCTYKIRNMILPWDPYVSHE